MTGLNDDGTVEVSNWNTATSLNMTHAEIKYLQSKGVSVRGYTKDDITVYESFAEYQQSMICLDRLTGALESMFEGMEVDLYVSEEAPVYGTSSKSASKAKKYRGISVRLSIAKDVNGPVDSVEIPAYVTEITGTWCSVRNVRFPDSVIQVNDRIFHTWVNDICVLQSFDFGDGIEKIPVTLFSDVADIQSVRIGKNIKSIPHHCFKSCTALRDVVLCEGLEEIAESAFMGCTSLQQLQLPSTLKHIGSSALAHTGLTELDLSQVSDIEQIDTCAFSNCANLQMVKWSERLTGIKRFMLSSLFQFDYNLKTFWADGRLIGVNGSCFAEKFADGEYRPLKQGADGNYIAENPANVVFRAFSARTVVVLERVLSSTVCSGLRVTDVPGFPYKGEFPIETEFMGDKFQYTEDVVFSKGQRAPKGVRKNETPVVHFMKKITVG